ncbi:MAG: cation transporter, partial [Elusimicrobia bacterium]|nr:cation transporter [Elusimicrobiota bacterium]
YTTAGVLIGLCAVKLTGLLWLDPAIAVAVGLFLARTGYKLVRESAAALLDQEDAPTIERIVSAINAMQESALKNLNIIAIHGLRAIRSGRYVHVDIHVVVPEYAAVALAHGHADRFEETLINGCDLDGEFHTHIDPCQRKYCGRCADNACKDRVSPFRQKLPLALEARAAEIKF